MKFQLSLITITASLAASQEVNTLRGASANTAMYDTIRDKMEETAAEFREFHEEHPHPLYEGVHKVVEQAKVVNDHIRDNIVRFHDELVSARHRLSDRLATYEAESGVGHFSTQCAKLSMGPIGGMDPCMEIEGCNWCTSDKLALFKIQGFCASQLDEELLMGWGVTCGEKAKEQDNPMWNFEVEESPEAAALDILVEEAEGGESELDTLDVAEAGDLTDLLMVSEVAYEQPEDEKDVEVLLLEEERDEEHHDKFCIEQESMEDCNAGEDEDGKACVWCKYNSWLGACVTAADADLVTGEFAMNCAENSMA